MDMKYKELKSEARDNSNIKEMSTAKRIHWGSRLGGLGGKSGESSIIEAKSKRAFQEVVIGPQCPMGFPTANLVKMVSIRKKG